MSEVSDDTLKEKTRKVVISGDDCKAALDFWKHFNIPLPDHLKEAIDIFQKSPSIETQDAVKLNLCRAIVESDHDAFKDEMFKKIVIECEGASFQMQFDRDLEQTLSDNGEKEVPKP